MTDHDLITALIRAADFLASKPLDAQAQALASELRSIASDRADQYDELVAFFARPQLEIESDHEADDSALLAYIGGDDLRTAWKQRDRWYA